MARSKKTWANRCQTGSLRGAEEESWANRGNTPTDLVGKHCQHRRGTVHAKEKRSQGEDKIAQQYWGPSWYHTFAMEPTITQNYSRSVPRCKYGGRAHSWIVLLDREGTKARRGLISKERIRGLEENVVSKSINQRLRELKCRSLWSESGMHNWEEWF